MRIVTFSDFGFSGGAIPVGNWRACGIAPNSNIDLAEVGGARVGPCSLVPCQAGMPVLPVRGFRSGALGTADTLAEQASNVRNLSTLALVLYEECDGLIPPGPRATWRGGGFFELPGAVNKLVVRAPFHGRKQAHVAVRGEDGVTVTDQQIIVRGIRYLPLEFLQGVKDSPEDYQPFVEEATPVSVFNGGASVPTSSVDPDIPSPNLLGRIENVGGGGDNQEGFDELEVWLIGDGGAYQGVGFVDVEVSGERG